MPDRYIPSELLEDWRYWRLSDTAARLYWSVRLLADDQGRVEGGEFYLRVVAMKGSIAQDRAAELVAELAAVELVLPYQDAAGAPFLLVPDFVCKKSYPKPSKLPDPPAALARVGARTGARTGAPAGARAGAGAGAGVGVGVKDSLTNASSTLHARKAVDKSKAPKATSEKAFLKERGTQSAQAESLPPESTAGSWATTIDDDGNPCLNTAGIEAKGRELGVNALPGENHLQYRDRLLRHMRETLRGEPVPPNGSPAERVQQLVAGLAGKLTAPTSTRSKPAREWWRTEAGIEREGKRRNLPAKPGESWRDWALRLRATPEPT